LQGEFDIVSSIEAAYNRAIVHPLSDSTTVAASATDQLANMRHIIINGRTTIMILIIMTS